ncbi:hypothetical protein [Hyphobacterium sp.]|jgi:hypothetical protein|uniref:hypothetical protein n=1 Tax=Hyphobacterium sp. TaxID=2004662 RepID=UPI003BAA7607
MLILRILVALGGLALGGLIWIAISQGDFGAAGAWLISDPWGQVTLLDLYLGFFLIAIVIALFERRLWRAIVWIAPLPILGNIWAAVWFVFALPKLARRLRA